MDAARAFAYFVGEQFGEAAAAAKKGLAQNPRSARTLRLLAASLARLGQRDQATAAIQELLAIDPQLTISKVRLRLSHWPQSVWNSYSEALRLAGGIGVSAWSEAEPAWHHRLKVVPISDAEMFSYTYIVCLAERRNRPLIASFLQHAKEGAHRTRKTRNPN